jgi:hypothetical protein
MAADGDPDPISAGTAGEAARWSGSSAVVGMAANPFGAHRVGVHRPTAWLGDMRPAMMMLGVPVVEVIGIDPPARPHYGVPCGCGGLDRNQL